jgi:hypothetical protein
MTRLPPKDVTMAAESGLAHEVAQLGAKDIGLTRP